MAIRLLPFRDYDEHDVVNLFKSAGALSNFIDLSSSTNRSTPEGDAGVFVKVDTTAGTLNSSTTDWDPIDVQTSPTSLLGKTDYPHIGRNIYPQASLSVTPTAAIDDKCIGITLRQTVARDENGENLLYNPIKKDELYGVLPGEAVPVLSAAGLGTKVKDASAGAAVFLGKGVDAGKFVVAADTATKGAQQVGVLIGIGNRDEVGTNPDYFSGNGTTGSYAVIKLAL
jgi:hypothetical protein